MTRLHYITWHVNVHCGIVTYGTENTETRPSITADRFVYNGQKSTGVIDNLVMTALQ